MPNKGKFAELSRLLNIRGFDVIGHIDGIDKAAIQLWKKYELVPEFENVKAGISYDFNAIEVIWLALLNQMKTYGVGNKPLKLCKDGLFSMIHIPEEGDFIALEYYIIEILTADIPIYAVLSDNTKFLMLDDKTFFGMLRSREIKNCTTFLLNEFIKESLPIIFSEPKFHEYSGLTDQEILILDIVRSKRYRYANIAKTEENVDSVEELERFSNPKVIEEIVRKQQYQKIEVKKQNGRFVSALRTTRTKFNKNDR